MLYPKLQSLKNYKKEVEYWRKELNDAKSGDSLTDTGMRKRNRREKLQQNLKEAETEYENLKENILTDEKYKHMEPYLKKACNEYYFNGKKEIDLADYVGENFLREVRNYCHSLK